MKKFILSLLAALILLLGGSNTTQAQVEKGNILIDPYIGVPSMDFSWLIFGHPVTAEPVHPIGSPVSFGGRAEYLLADNFGLKLDVNYRIAGFKSENQFYNDLTGNWEIGETRNTTNAFRVMIGFNYHFVQTVKLDIYTGFSAGFKYKKRTESFNGVSQSVSYDDLLITSVPAAVRISIGGRYYFHPNVGINFEIGALGGSPVQLGVAVKF